MKTFSQFITEEYSDSKGELISHGDYLHNPHTGDVGQVDSKKGKLVYHNGSKGHLKSLGVSDWWHKITKDEYENRASKNTSYDKDSAELKRLTKNLTK